MKNNLKRMTALFLILALCLTLTACSGGKETAGTSAQTPAAEAAEPAAAAASDDSASEAEAAEPAPEAETADPEPEEEAADPDYGAYAVGEGVLMLRLVTPDPLYDGKFSGYQEGDGWVMLVFEPGGGRITFGDISDFSKKIEIDGCEFENMSGTLGEEGAISDLSSLAIAEDAFVYYLFDAPADFAFTAELLHVDAPSAE